MRCRRGWCRRGWCRRVAKAIGYEGTDGVLDADRAVVLGHRFDAVAALLRQSLHLMEGALGTALGVEELRRVPPTVWQKAIHLALEWAYILFRKT